MVFTANVDVKGDMYIFLPLNAHSMIVLDSPCLIDRVAGGGLGRHHAKTRDANPRNPPRPTENEQHAIWGP